MSRLAPVAALDAAETLLLRESGEATELASLPHAGGSERQGGDSSDLSEPCRSSAVAQVFGPDLASEAGLLQRGGGQGPVPRKRCRVVASPEVRMGSMHLPQKNQPPVCVDFLGCSVVWDLGVPRAL